MYQTWLTPSSRMPASAAVTERLGAWLEENPAEAKKICLKAALAAEASGMACSRSRPSGRFLPRKKLRERWKTLMGKHKPEQLVCYCGSGVTACHDLLALEVAGLEGARLFPPSWSGWCRTEGLPVERGK